MSESVIDSSERSGTQTITRSIADRQKKGLPEHGALTTGKAKDNSANSRNQSPRGIRIDSRDMHGAEFSIPRTIGGNVTTYHEGGAGYDSVLNFASERGINEGAYLATRKAAEPDTSVDPMDWHDRSMYADGDITYLVISKDGQHNNEIYRKSRKFVRSEIKRRRQV